MSIESSTAQHDTEPIDEFAPDVIVVGGGSAGCVAARRLIDRSDVRVLMLECGGPDDNPAIHDPSRFPELWLAEEDWAYYTAPQAHAAERELHWPRGRVLGGSGSLNAMIYVRGARADYDHWAYLGNDGWAWDDVLAVFTRMEDFDAGASEYHGEGGPLRILTRYELAPIHASIIAAAEAVGIPRNDDYNCGHLDGISQHQLTIRDGRRHSSAVAYLSPVAGDPNLRVLTRATARRLLFEGTRCVGVEWEHGGRVRRTHAGSEVVVSAGAIGSPRLLLLSGIGPGEELRALGLEVLLDLPGVGRNLHDHILSPVIHAAEREIAPPTPGHSATQTHLFARSRPGLPVPDTQPIHFAVPMYEDWMEGPENGFTMMAGMIRPASRGSVRLTGPDPEDPLRIDPRILSAGADLEALAFSLSQVREIAAAVPLRREWGARELYPGPEVKTGAEIRDYIRRTAITYHHQAGTCKMGLDVDAVVDPRLRVHGIDGLRVADASIMPAVISGNTNAPSMMIGERVAEFIADDHAAAAAGVSAAA
jgi:choline dehydrogenase-like flavoprotein